MKVPFKRFYHLAMGSWLDGDEMILGTAAYLRVSIQRQDLLLRVQQLAGVRNVDGCFLFVSGQHPYLQAGLPE